MKKEEILLFERDGMKVYWQDVVRLTNGMVVAIDGMIGHDDGDEEDDNKIIFSTTPISSICSYCYPEHVQEVVMHFSSFGEQLEWCHENMDMFRGNPLHIELEREKK